MVFLIYGTIWVHKSFQISKHFEISDWLLILYIITINIAYIILPYCEPFKAKGNLDKINMMIITANSKCIWNSWYMLHIEQNK